MPDHACITHCLVEMLAEFLECAPQDILPGSVFADLGADSFDMVELQVLVEERLQVTLEHPLPVHTSFTGLVEQVDRAMAVSRPARRR
ncbi:acyl carrier protein [Pseudomonas entomophila]|uniref:acyl carrier protein n=1 Tax=Pseudomonas entomophila TaxID=312306 RepID=UPI0023D7E71E|nr:acyl carrier protein [Pseudomonas entomophila]MDF0730924.1 acyl carrier protein [Pseudomonas entomophila]